MNLFPLILAEAWSPSDVIAVIGSLTAAALSIIAALKSQTAQVQSQATADSLSRLSSRVTRTQDNLTSVALRTPAPKEPTDETQPPSPRF